jgi:hypothetical protein
MEFTSISATIQGLAAYTQSHKHDEPKLEGENADDYDRRTWRSKMNTQPTGRQKPGPKDGEMVPELAMIIPAFGIHDALVKAAQHSQLKIVGQRYATWTAKFKSGIGMMGPAVINVDPDSIVIPTVLSMNADGKRGSGARVTRRFPQIPPGWLATFEAMILDPVITEKIFRLMLERAGLYIGVGQYRPEVGGSNGRFRVHDVVWTDKRELVPYGINAAA